MATYHVDLANPGAWNGRDGSDSSGNQWLGASGLQMAADTITAGNTIHVNGTVDLSTLKSLVCDDLVGVFVRGEGVTWSTGTTGTGVVSEITANSPTVIEVLTGTLADDDELVGTTSGATDTVAGAPATKTAGLNIDTQTGDATPNGYIKFIGVASLGGSNDGTKAQLNGNSGSTNCIDPVTVDYIWLENFEIYSATGNGVADGGNGNDWVFINTIFRNNGGQGIDGNNFENAIFIRCNAYSNTDYGFYNLDTSSRLLFCVSYNNTDGGFSCYSTHYYIMFFGCLAHGNGGAGDYGFSGCVNGTIINCVSDGNGDDGIYCPINGMLIIGNRLTENGAYGIDFNSVLALYGWNYAPAGSEDRDNTSGTKVNDGLAEALSIAGVATNNLAGTDTDGGYNAPATDDFNLTSDATLKRTEIDLGVGS